MPAMSKSKHPHASARMKPYFKASVQSDNVLELRIYTEIGADMFGNGLTAETVAEALDQVGDSCNRILLRINSPGGDCFEGVAIRSLLRSQNKPIDVCIDGLAASAATIIAMAGDNIQMAPGAMMMIHDAWSICIGKDTDMHQMGDVLTKVSSSIAEVYVERTGQTVDELSAVMDREAWLTGKECIDMGLADGMSEKADARAMAMAGKLKSRIDQVRGLKGKSEAEIMAGLKRIVAAELKAEINNDDLTGEDDDTEVCACDCEDCMAEDCENCSTEDCMDSVCATEGCPGQETEEGDDDPDPDEPYAAVTEPVVASIEPEATPQAESNLNQYEARLKFLRGQ